ncbi:hypothetical protein DFH09DRAFT_1167112 [Mycena vulgaris]|nr:hypothetical protein DFH09DRAFT_1167112 [Mycena vulgaris]
MPASPSALETTAEYGEPRQWRSSSIPPSIMYPELANWDHDRPGLSDTDRLVHVLQKGFRDLKDTNRPKTSATSKEITFWTEYKTLADEYDKEFHQKYSTDLDTSLIFAGLFSAVDSAFIIQIQPEFKPGPDGPGPSTLVIAAQILLYISLFATLLAALLSVLGKQWLLHYGEAGNRGTIEERGLERQHKLEGLRKWKFEYVMQAFPLLLQLALLLFWAALSVYLWTINLPLAVTVITLTSLSTISYIILLISAMKYPNSPYQTPLSSLLVVLTRPIVWSYKKAKFRDSVWVTPRKKT